MKQGREASGRHGKRSCSGRGTGRAASEARTVERGKNPEDGTGEGLATFTLRGGSVRRGDKGHPT